MSGLLALTVAVAGGAGLAAAGLASLARRGADRRLAARFATVTRPYARARGVAERVAARRSAPVALPPAIEARIAAAFGWSPERRDQYPLSPWLVVLAALLVGLAGAYFAGKMFGPWGRLLGVVVWVAVARGVFGMVHGRRADALYRQLPDALGMVVRGVRAGLPVLEALRTVARECPDPTGAEFRRLADQLAIGISMEQSLRSLARRSGLPEYGFFAVSLTLQNQAGGNLTETLDNLADVVRKRAALRERGHALASQAKTSAIILAAVPVVAGLALAVINPRYLSVLFHDPRGNGVLGGAIGMLSFGMLVMRIIIKRSLA